MRKIGVLLSILMISHVYGLSLWIKGGGGNTEKKIYDENGNVEDNFYQVNAFYTKLGVEHNILPMWFLGGELSMYSVAVKGELQFIFLGIPIVQPIDLKSGFKPQYVSLFTGVSFLFARASIGYMIDLGPDAGKTEDENDIGNSDLQDAIAFKLSAKAPIPAFTLGASLEYYLTMETTKTFEDTTTGVKYEQKADSGDYLVAALQAGYKIAVVEIGTYLYYWSKTQGTKEGQTSDDWEYREKNLLSLAPYIGVSLPLIDIELRLAADGEYEKYGLPLSGKNVERPSLGANLTVKLSF